MTPSVLLGQGSPKYDPRATSGPLRPAELSLKKQTKLGKLNILTPLYSDMYIGKIHDMYIGKIHVAVCKALCLIMQWHHCSAKRVQYS